MTGLAADSIARSEIEQEGSHMGLATAIFGWMLLNLAFNLPTARALGGGVVALRYDSEHRPMGSGGASVMIRLRWKF